jgi:hypothetical protein
MANDMVTRFLTIDVIAGQAEKQGKLLDFDREKCA